MSRVHVRKGFLVQGLLLGFILDLAFVSLFIIALPFVLKLLIQNGLKNRFVRVWLPSIPPGSRSILNFYCSYIKYNPSYPISNVPKYSKFEFACLGNPGLFRRSLLADILYSACPIAYSTIFQIVFFCPHKGTEK